VEVAPVDEKAKKAVEKDKGKAKGKGKGKDGAAAEDAAPAELISSIFVPEIEQSVQDYVAKWQDRDESMNFAQKYDPDLVKDELRPIVFEEIRLQVDGEMRVLLENLKVCLLRPPALHAPVDDQGERDAAA
jgi:IQ and AAA domain-containing protein